MSHSRSLLPVVFLVLLVAGAILIPRLRTPESASERSDRTRPPETWPDTLPERGRWWPAEPLADSLTVDQREARDRLLALGYLAGSRPPRGRGGVVRYDPACTGPGLNLHVSGHAPEAVLTDLTGRPLHRWSVSFARAFPGYPVPGGARGVQYFRRAHLDRDGDLLAIFEGFGLVRLDRDSRVVWANPARFHHDLFVTADGTIWGLTRRAHILPRVHPREPVLEDFLVEVDPAGTIRREISVLEAFEGSAFRDLIAAMPDSGDLFHTNTIEVLESPPATAPPEFRPGCILVSLLTVGVIAVVDPEQRVVVWARRGSWRAQHQPALLASGRILLFDNRGDPAGSRLLEIDPRTGREVWSYTGAPQDRFYSFDCGSSQRLVGGNTLITESNEGRAFEITPEGEIVWEFLSPHRAGERGELVATLFEVVRLEGWSRPAWAAVR